MNSDPSGYSTTSILIGVATQILGLILCITPTTYFRLGFYIFLGIASAVLSIWGYNKAIDKLNNNKKKMSQSAYNSQKNTLNIMLSISLISASVTFICGALGMYALKKKLEWIGLMILGFSGAWQFTNFGISYDAADILSGKFSWI